MRILILHNFYQQAGGEDVVVANEHQLLVDHGHEVRLYSVSNDDIKGAWRKIQTAFQASYSAAARDGMRSEIAAFTPDIVHVHNFFPLLTPSIYDACREAGAPIVQTLHNYRTICAGALLMRGGRLCEDCIGGSPYQAVLHGCYRDSRLGSFAVARMVDVHRRRGTWRTKVDRFIALTEFAKAKFVEASFPAEKITVKPNFVEATKSGEAENTPRNGALFVGRLSHEKGILTMLRTWSTINAPLRIAGDGPLHDTVVNADAKHVTCLGRKSPDEVAVEMERASFLVFPSEWYEGFPMTLAESFSHALPVIASRLGSMAEIVEDGVTGLLFTPGDADDLAAKVRWAADHPDEMRRMGLNARKVYERKYTPEANYRRLITIYEEAIAENRRSTPT